MFTTKRAKGILILFTFFFLSAYVFELDAYARAGGSRSFGSRGSRSYSAPSRTAPSQSSPQSVQPQRSMNQPAQQPGGFMRGMAGGIAGGLLGGMLGGMLFGGLGHAGSGGFGGSGMGFMDILLIGAILYGIYWFIKRKRAQAAQATAGYQSSGVEPIQPGSASYAPSYVQPAGDDLNAGVDHIRQMDPYFDEKKFQDSCMDNFFKIQGAWMNRDMSGVKDLLTDEMFVSMGKDADRLKADKRINHLENIAVRSVDLTEVWQEQGNDFITVKFYANLLDYTTDESGQVLEGSKTDPVKFEEYWTFTRPVGANAWRLSAITQAN